MPISGRIAVEVEFLDTASGPLSKTTKTLSLKEANEYTTGKVAIASGTVGTTVINTQAIAYKDASGSVVSFASLQRAAFAASPMAFLDISDAITEADVTVVSRSNEVTLVDARNNSQFNFYTTSGTASYTLILYGT